MKSSNKKRQESTDELISNEVPLYFLRKKTSLEFKPVQFRSLKGNKFNFDQYKEDHTLKGLDLHKHKKKKPKVKLDYFQLETESVTLKRGDVDYKKSKDVIQDINNQQISGTHLSKLEVQEALQSTHLPYSDDLVQQHNYLNYLKQLGSYYKNPQLPLPPSVAEYNKIARIHESLRQVFKTKFTASARQDECKLQPPASRGFRVVMSIEVSDYLTQRLAPKTT